MSRPAESMTIDGVTHSWYCTVCGAELGADLDEYDGMPPAGCALHGTGHLAWETWNVVTDPAYPHRIIRVDERIGGDVYDFEWEPEGWCPSHEDWYDDCPCYVAPSGAVYPSSEES
ncbi:hypothetical protein SEA_BABYDOTZ_3 [Microbacterium phage BabyDotz]|uniref:Uncharacterized protein n=1 Tax=Microbacterium phage Judebell TaxID=3230835 RepID=A0AAU8EG98_9CAUD|nr:hypothetical protein SEA_BABYDOTZ_3 [Microbacterium phage BabyDotz]